MIIKINDKIFENKTDKEKDKIIADIFQGNFNITGLEIYGEPKEEKEPEPKTGFNYLKPEFKEELRNLVNKHCLESDSQTPDWCIANYLINCLLAMNIVISSRDIWYEDDKKLTVTNIE